MTRYQFHELSNSGFIGLDRWKSILVEITANQMSSGISVGEVNEVTRQY